MYKSYTIVGDQIFINQIALRAAFGVVSLIINNFQIIWLFHPIFTRITVRISKRSILMLREGNEDP